VFAVFVAVIALATFPARLFAVRPLPFAKQRATIRAIVYGANTPPQRDQAISSLMRIVGDDKQDRWLRVFAAEGLGELGAVEAEKLLGELASRLPWAEPDTRLKSAAHLGEWQIKVTKESDRGKKIQLLKEALMDQFDGLIEWRVQDWAGSELANMGAKEAMPQIIESIQRREPPERAPEIIRFQQAKIDILSRYPGRMEALTYALASLDTDKQHKIKLWAITELAKVRSQESVNTLVSYALELQKRYYDEKGNRKPAKDDPLSRYISDVYNEIIHILTAKGMDRSAMNRMGLYPDKFSRVVP
jgi:hypothetical protein